MGKEKEDIIKETAEFWKNRTGEDLSSEDARGDGKQYIRFFPSPGRVG